MKKKFKIYINDLLILLYLKDNFKTFVDNLVKLVNKKSIKWFKKQEENNDLKSHSFIKFCKQNKEAIKIINTYSSLDNFINNFCDLDNNISLKRDIFYFYEYLNDHKEKYDQIKSLVNKLAELNIVTLTLDSNVDFTKKAYVINKKFHHNYEIEYVMNRTIVYEDDSIIKYKTNNSLYKISLGISKENFSPYIRNITVNDLLFDVSYLPPSLSKEEVFDSIIQEKISVDQCLKSLLEQINELSNIIKELEKLDYDNEVVDDFKKYLSIMHNILPINEEKTIKNKSLKVGG